MYVQTGTPLYAPIDVSTSGDHVVVPSRYGYSIRVLKYTLMAAGAVAIQWKTDDGSVLSGPMTFASVGNGIIETTDPDGHFVGPLHYGLVLNLSANVAVGGHLVYTYTRDQASN